MPEHITIRRTDPPDQMWVDLPRSKSVANRALVLAALAGDPSCVVGPHEADDTRILNGLLCERPAVMYCGAGGTTLRFALAWACVQEGEERMITGDEGLLERPHTDLVKALLQLGADVEREASGFRVRGKKIPGGPITIISPSSSQFISALLLIAPMMRDGLSLRWTGRRLSGPYVRMTIKALRRFGAVIEEQGDMITVRSSPLVARPFHVPADWSAASFWYEAAALRAGPWLWMQDLKADGWQGDERAAELWRPWVAPLQGTVHGIVGERQDKVLNQVPAVDLSGTPDLFQPLAFTCAGLGSAAHFTGLHNLHLKETDRITAVADALRVLGIVCDADGGTFTMSGRITNMLPLPFDPRGDHRMAMALAPLALVCDAITILHPTVVGKSYPAYWEHLRGAGFTIDG